MVDELSALIGPEHIVIGDVKKLKPYGHDQVANPKYGHLPDLVVFPDTAEQISELLKFANRERIPVTPRGGGSGLSGGAVPIYGGIVLSFDRMNRVREIDERNLVAVVEPGVVTKELDLALRESGLFFAGYPMSEEICTIGGNVAENAGGGRAVKYGVTSRYVLGVEAVLPSGDVVSIGGKRYKDVTGFDLLHLLTGSEGTLAVFSEITLRLLPRPVERLALRAYFETDGAAADVVPLLLRNPRILPSAIEFIDETSLRVTREHLRVGEEGNRRPLLLVEIDGDDPEHVKRRLDLAASVCVSAGAEVSAATGDDELAEIWKIRKQIPWALKKLNPKLTAEDIVVPVGELGTLIQIIREVEKRHRIMIPCFGHAADGNLHASPMKRSDMSDEEWEIELGTILTELYIATARVGGTISGEHGIGHKRKGHLHHVMEGAHLELLKQVKRSFDPKNILNPGKIIDLP